MPEGQCLCGDIRISYSGEPVDKRLCHCRDCRKISGGAYSVNFIVPADKFEVVSGAPKTFSKTADSGNNITSFFCGRCGTTLWREPEKPPGVLVIKAGILEGTEVDDEMPRREAFVSRRPPWISPLPNAKQDG